MQRLNGAEIWGEAVEKRLAEAGTNRLQIVNALRDISAARREGMEFLISNMPSVDLSTLPASFLLENVNLAYEAREKSPWQSLVPKEIFLNDVLPYACMSERRDPWRAELRRICEPVIAGCRKTGEAGHLLNQKIFSLLNVRYSTGRKRPDQSPNETMKSGVATCTGLSILLVDACRSVGIPARVVGTPMWSNMRGNHTWVEIWDGDWHFAGAAEPDAAGLDHGWFVNDASQAQRDVPRHAIYATSFQKTGTAFPMVWVPGDKSVQAVNVTDRYAAKSPVIASGKVQLAAKVVDSEGKRVAADLRLFDPADTATLFKDKSRGETADLNDLAKFEVVPGRKYHLVATLGNRQEETDIIPTAAADQLITLSLTTKTRMTARPAYAVPQQPKPVSAKDAVRFRKEFVDYFTAPEPKQTKWSFPKKLQKLLKINEPAARQLAWEAFRDAPIHSGLKTNFTAQIVKAGDYLSPYTVKTVGERPKGGWPLFIAMHGGGNAPKELNDRQWKQMQVYYKDHPEVGGYKYLALRAPNDSWNGFYADYVYPLIDTLILQFRLFGDIDPDKVFILGYSHGGYGAYAIGPKMPDRFAAIHASAAAATDGETTPKTLRTTPFTVMVGERDTMYGRYSRNLSFKQEIEKLRGKRTDIYPVTITIVPGNGHTGLPDRDKILEMYPAVRNPVPREMDWFMTDGVVEDFFWLRVPRPGKGQEILASCENNRVVFTANEGVTNATVFMDTRLVDLAKPVDIELNGVTSTHQFTPSLHTFCETLARRGDPDYAFSAAFTVVKDAATGRLAVTSPTQRKR